MALLTWVRPYLDNNLGRTEKFIHHIRERAGLLIRHKTAAYTFPHRTFQEFMAACHLTGMKDYPKSAADLLRGNPDQWRMVFILSAGHAARLGMLGNAISSVSKLCPEALSETEQLDEAAYNLAMIGGEALLEIGLVGVKREGEGKAVLKRIKHWLLAAMEDDKILAPPRRVSAGNVLADLGDPRFDPDNWYLPREENFAFVPIPEGQFWMGSDKKRDPMARKDETRHRVHLSAYGVGRYPVTVAQYRAFALDTEQELTEEWREYNRYPNHPVVMVSWHDAMAYCEWLTVKLRGRGWVGTVSLPTEAQWERTARGDDERIHPWGNEESDLNRANYWTNTDSDIGATSPVGCYPAGIGVAGLHDLAGNVWEWCLDHGGIGFGKNDFSVTTDCYQNEVNNPLGGKGSFRVMRGGSWFLLGGSCRAAYRLALRPSGRYHYLGFRLVLSGQISRAK